MNRGGKGEGFIKSPQASTIIQDSNHSHIQRPWYFLLVVLDAMLSTLSKLCKARGQGHGPAFMD